ncbi:MAG: 3-hydroxyacyl-CoA dehydrogenase NAD-binding domain-containing protein, partial [Planctomycetota bacterium]
GHHARRKGRRLTRNWPVARLIGSRARAAVMKQTRGNYPAPPRAVEVLVRGASRSVAGGLALERDAVVELARTPAGRNLMEVFLLRERARHLDPAEAAGAAADRSGVGTAAVIGAGVMGAGIAQWLAARRIPVVLRDVNDAALARGMASIEKLFREGARRGAFDPRAARDGLDRIRPSAVDVPLGNVDVVVEAAVEELGIKRRIFGRLEELAAPETVLATNTSSLSLAAIAEGLEHPGRVAGLHFFNPVHRMELVEVVVGDRTDPAVAARMVRLVQEIGKLPVVVRDRPGFCVNRVLFPYLGEAGRLFDEGVPPREIDEAMLDFGMPMGPLRLLDEVGLDIAVHVAEHLHDGFGDRMEIPAILGRMVEAGLWGRKKQAGFYLYGRRVEVNPEAARLAGSGGAPGREELQQRMVLPLLNEAARCVEEEVVADPRDVDLALVMGTGFAPFRGGPLRHADTVGLAEVVAALERRGAARFAPAGLLRSMAEGGRRFHGG